MLTDQEELMVEVCVKPGAQRFVSKLVELSRQQLPGDLLDFTDTHLSDALAIVRWMRSVPSAERDIKHALLLVRRALYDSDQRCGIANVQLDESERAAVAAYYTVACKLVDLAARNSERLNTTTELVVRVMSDQRIVCGIVANALVGGRLMLERCDGDVVPTPRCVFVVRPGPNGEQRVSSLERALHSLVHGNDRRTTKRDLDSEALSDDEKDELTAALDSIRSVKRETLALVVDVAQGTDSCATLAVRWDIPVLVHDSSLTRDLLAMTPGAFMAQAREFHRELDARRAAVRTERQPPNETAEGDKADMSGNPTGVQITNHGNAQITFTTGARSAAHAHARQSVDRRTTRIELDGLLQELRDLRSLIDGLPAGKDREGLAARAEQAREAVEKPEKQDKGAIKKALTWIKETADGLKGGEEIAGYAARLLAAVAQCFGS